MAPMVASFRVRAKLRCREGPQRSAQRTKRSQLVVACVARQSVQRELSGVMKRIQPSKTVALSDLAKTLKQEGKDVISFAVGEPDFPTPDPVNRAAIEAIREGVTKYTQNVGTLELRTAICEKLKRENGLEYGVDGVVVSNGAKQAAWQAITATCGPGDEVLIPAPYWVSYPEMAVMAGAEPKIVPCSISEGFLLTAAALEQVLTENSRLLILCTPSNPTGAMYTRFGTVPDRTDVEEAVIYRAQLEAIAEVVQRHPRLLVLSDEIYEYMAYLPAEHVSFAALPEMHERTLTVNGFSKGFSMTGWRLGYLAAPVDYAKRAGVAALKMGNRGGPIVAQMVETYRERRDYVVQRLRGIEGMEVLQPDGAFYVFPDVSAFLDGGAHSNGSRNFKTAEELCMHLLQEALVALIPGDAFGAPGHFRLSYATSMELLEEGLNRIENALTR